MNSRFKTGDNQVRKVLSLITIAFLVYSSVFIFSNMFFITGSKASAEDVEWSVTLSITEPDGASDTVVFGEAVDASDGKDNYDIPKPPTPQTPYIRAWFTTNLDLPYNTLWEDYRVYPDDYKVWNLSVMWVPENDSSTNVTISWDISQIVDTGYTSALLYRDDDVVADMITDSSYTYISSANALHNFQIVHQSETSQDGTSDTNQTTSLLPIFLFIIVAIVIAIFALLWKKTKT